MLANRSSLPSVVVIGAGFGGLAAARALGSSRVDVTLVDRNNYHTFQPLLYQVATAGLEPEEIAHAVRGIYRRQANVRFRMATVSGVDLDGKSVRLDDGSSLAYDFLIVAAGTATADYGIPGVREHGLGLKTLADAVRLRAHVLQQFEAAARDPSLVDRGWLNFVIVGGGATGVEMAGALVELFLVLRKDYRSFDVARAKVILIERDAHLLDPYHPRLREYARAKLAKRGVELWLATSVASASESAVVLASGEAIPTRTLVWAAGVRASALADRIDAPRARGGRIEVAPDLSLAAHAEVFIVGDLAASTDAKGKLLPQVAPVAIQGGRHAARTIADRIEGRASIRFRYHHRGDMATIGRNAAVAQFPGGITVRGFLAWQMWLWLHLVQLVGFRNRLNVFINWTWNYFTYDRGARLILPIEDRADELPPAS